MKEQYKEAYTLLDETLRKNYEGLLKVKLEPACAKYDRFETIWVFSMLCVFLFGGLALGSLGLSNIPPWFKVGSIGFLILSASMLYIALHEEHKAKKTLVDFVEVVNSLIPIGMSVSQCHRELDAETIKANLVAMAAQIRAYEILQKVRKDQGFAPLTTGTDLQKIRDKADKRFGFALNSALQLGLTFERRQIFDWAPKFLTETSGSIPALNTEQLAIIEWIKDLVVAVYYQPDRDAMLEMEDSIQEFAAGLEKHHYDARDVVLFHIIAGGSLKADDKYRRFDFGDEESIVLFIKTLELKLMKSCGPTRVHELMELVRVQKSKDKK